MNCEHAIELLATGTAVGRSMARRHAVRCPSCAAEAAGMARLAHALAAVEPITPAQRALWTSASTEPRGGEARMPWSRRVRLAATGAVFVLCAVLTFVTFRPSPRKPPIDPPITVTVNTGNDRRQISPELDLELNSLTSGLRALSQELVQLRRHAELLDERRDAESLARRSVAMNGP
jgi:hypothetical protein